jgi:hypothetical protein
MLPSSLAVMLACIARCELACFARWERASMVISLRTYQGSVHVQSNRACVGQQIAGKTLQKRASAEGKTLRS